MNGLIRLLTSIDKMLLITLKTISIISFVILTVLLTAVILARFIPFMSLLWCEEVIELVFACMIFYGSAALWITKEHFNAGNFVENRFFKDEKYKRCYRIALELMGLAFAAIFFYYSYRLTMNNNSVTNVLAIPKKMFYVCMPISGAIMTIYSIRNIWKEMNGFFKTAA